jgi:PDZ domain-containing protein
LGAALIVVAVLEHVSTSTYALTPGDATSVAPLVSVSGLTTDPHRDRILLTDVYLTKLTAWQWIIYHFMRHVEFVPAADLEDPGVPTDELAAQGYLQMSDSKQAAEVAALRALGWHLSAVASGATVTGVEAHSPARAAHLRVADRIVAVDGHPVTSGCALVRRVHDTPPGTRVTFGVERATISGKGVITWGAAHPLAVVSAAARASAGPTRCAGVSGPAHSWLGVTLEDALTFALPGRIAIDTSYIGGPSAGLAMTLALVDRLSEGSLTGGRAIAATGTIAPDGAVGDVGGVAEKTVAVERAGAQIFFVPAVEVATARANAGPGLTVVGVSRLSQVLADLRRLGGADPVPLSPPKPVAAPSRP